MPGISRDVISLSTRPSSWSNIHLQSVDSAQPASATTLIYWPQETSQRPESWHNIAWPARTGSSPSCKLCSLSSHTSTGNELCPGMRLAAQQQASRSSSLCSLLALCHWWAPKSFAFSSLPSQLKTPEVPGTRKDWVWVFRQEWPVFSPVFPWEMKSSSTTQYFWTPPPTKAMLWKYHFEREAVEWQEALAPQNVRRVKRKCFKDCSEPRSFILLHTLFALFCFTFYLLHNNPLQYPYFTVEKSEIWDKQFAQVSTDSYVAEQIESFTLL